MKSMDLRVGCEYLGRLQANPLAFLLTAMTESIDTTDTLFGLFAFGRCIVF